MVSYDNAINLQGLGSGDEFKCSSSIRRVKPVNAGGMLIVSPFLMTLCSFFVIDSTAAADEKDVDWIIMHGDDQHELPPESIKNKTNIVGADKSEVSLLNKLIDGGHVVTDQSMFRNYDSLSISTILEHPVTRHRLLCIADFNLSGARIFESCNEI